MADFTRIELIEELHNLGRCLGFHFKHSAVEIAEAAAALIESQAAELKERTAELERLTPRPMTLQEAAEVLNKHGYKNQKWQPREISSGAVWLRSDGLIPLLDDFTAHAVAHWLEITEKEAARG